MTPADILRMAKQVDVWAADIPLYHPQLERFAALVAAAEREACAKIAWNHEPDENGPIETAIRARGEKP